MPHFESAAAYPCRRSLPGRESSGPLIVAMRRCPSPIRHSTAAIAPRKSSENTPSNLPCLRLRSTSTTGTCSVSKAVSARHSDSLPASTGMTSIPLMRSARIDSRKRRSFSALSSVLHKKMLYPCLSAASVMPRSRCVKNGFSISGTRKPMLPVSPVLSLRATAFGV